MSSSSKDNQTNSQERRPKPEHRDSIINQYVAALRILTVMQISHVLGCSGRSIQGPLPTRFTHRLQNVPQLTLGTRIRLGLALAVQPLRVDAPVVAAEEVGQIEALRLQSVNFIFSPRLDPVDTVTLGECDHQGETGLLKRCPKILPRYS